MTPTEIRIAMAELDNWTNLAYRNGNRLSGFQKAGYYADRTNVAVPDYPNDLNAVHRVEERLVDSECQKCTYIDKLVQVTKADQHIAGGIVYWCVYHATARQRCEAILRTVGKWKESAG
jgi:predicted RecB family nuclease